MDLSSTDESCNITSVSKLFKNFCSTLVAEFIMKIGLLLEKEIETRRIKTINANIVKTVVSHYHIICNAPELKTNDFVNKTSKKYYAYIELKKDTNSKKDTKLSQTQQTNLVVQ